MDTFCTTPISDRVGHLIVGLTWFDCAPILSRRSFSTKPSLNGRPPMMLQKRGRYFTVACGTVLLGYGCLENNKDDDLHPCSLLEQMVELDTESK